MADKHLTAEQVLHVLNEGPVDLSELELCVITKLGDDKQNHWVFALGEVLVVGPSGRESFGEGRKPGKWDVEAHYTRDWDEAWKLSAAVRAEQGGEESAR